MSNDISLDNEIKLNKHNLMMSSSAFNIEPLEASKPLSLMGHKNLDLKYKILNKPNKKEKKDINPLPKKEDKFFKPRKDDFNYLELNINNEENEDILNALSNFMQIFKSKIEEKCKEKEIEVKFKEEKDMSFTLYYNIQPKVVSEDKIEYLDEDFEKKVKNVQKYSIKVELVEGDKSLFIKNKINQYYLLFNGELIDKEDFYEHLKILKNIAKDLLLNNNKDEMCSIL